MCLNIGTHKTINNFPFGINGKLMVFGVPYLSTLGSVHQHEMKWASSYQNLDTNISYQNMIKISVRHCQSRHWHLVVGMTEESEVLGLILCLTTYFHGN